MSRRRTLEGRLHFRYFIITTMLLLGLCSGGNLAAAPQPKNSPRPQPLESGPDQKDGPQLQRIIFPQPVEQTSAQTAALGKVSLPKVQVASPKEVPVPLLEIAKKMVSASEIPLEGPLLDANLESLAPGIRLRADMSMSRKTTDENGLPAMSVNDWIRFSSHEVTKTLGVCACDLVPRLAKESRELSKLVPLGQTSLKDANGKKFAVSVVSFEQALTIFQGLEGKIRRIKNSIRDGCHARAYESARQLERHGILVGKAMATGKFQILSDNLNQGKVNWSFHVAPMLVVQEGLKRSVWVLDPALFSEPVRLETWLSILMQHPRAELKEVFLTNRFVLHPNHRFETLTHWRTEDIRTVERLLKDDKIEQRPTRFATLSSSGS